MNRLLSSINGGTIITINPVTIPIIIMYVTATLRILGNLSLTKKLTSGDKADTKITDTNKIIKRSRIKYVIQRDSIKRAINITVL